MTISTSVGTEFKVGRLVKIAFRKASLINAQLEPNRVQMAEGLEEMQLLIRALPRRGLHAHELRFENVTCVAGTTTYQLSVNAIDVVGDGKVIPEGEDPDASSSETLCIQVKQDAWHRNAAKGARGRPTQFYTKREGLRPSVVVWPIPESADTIRFHVQRRIADALDANVTLDLQEYWYDHVTLELAYRLATNHNLPGPKLAQLRADSEAAFKEARRKAGETPATVPGLGWRP